MEEGGRGVEGDWTRKTFCSSFCWKCCTASRNPEWTWHTRQSEGITLWTVGLSQDTETEAVAVSYNPPTSLFISCVDDVYCTAHRSRRRPLDRGSGLTGSMPSRGYSTGSPSTTPAGVRYPCRPVAIDGHHVHAQRCWRLTMYTIGTCRPHVFVCNPFCVQGDAAVGRVYGICSIPATEHLDGFCRKIPSPRSIRITLHNRYTAIDDPSLCQGGRGRSRYGLGTPPVRVNLPIERRHRLALPIAPEPHNADNGATDKQTPLPQLTSTPILSSRCGRQKSGIHGARHRKAKHNDHR
jgi:hypothetical protein